jgi:hypothetical protein
MTIEELECDLALSSPEEDDYASDEWDPKEDLWEALELLSQAADVIEAVIHLDSAKRFLGRKKKKEFLELFEEINGFTDGYEPN